MSSTYRKPFHSNLYYHVLSRVDLSRDAANLYAEPGLLSRLFGGEPEWAAPLKSALEGAPAFMTAQILPLAVEDLRELRAWLSDCRRPFDDLPGRDLAERLMWALRTEEANYRRAFDRAGAARMESFRATVKSTLDLLLDALWSGRRPELTVVACDPLTDGEFSHGRCYRTPVEQVVAVSFQGDPVMSAIQILHEVTHAVTDPDVLAQHPGEERTTAVGSDGYEIHVALERAVIAHDRKLIAHVAPEWTPAYEKWCGRWR